MVDSTSVSVEVELVVGSTSVVGNSLEVVVGTSLEVMVGTFVEVIDGRLMIVGVGTVGADSMKLTEKTLSIVSPRDDPNKHNDGENTYMYILL